MTLFYLTIGANAWLIALLVIGGLAVRAGASRT